MPPILHSELGASSASRWMSCPASVRMSREAELIEIKQGRNASKTSVYAAEGTCAHEVCEMLLRKETSVDHLRGVTKKVGDYEITIDDEMISSAETYISAIYGMCGEDADVEVEHRFSLDWLYKGMFGTCDCAYLDTENRKLYIFDFKYGRGHTVRAEGNPQLRYYALGVLGPYSATNTKADTVVMTIVQPRSYVGVDTWECSTKELYRWAYNELLPAAKLTEKEDAPFNPGEDQCRWCRAAPICPALYAESMNIIQEFFPTVKVEERTPDVVKEIVLPPVNELTPEQMAKVLTVASTLTDYFNAVETDALDRLKHGVEVPGYKLVRGRSNRVWSDSSQAESMLYEYLGDRAYEKKLISPAKAEKLVDKKSLSPYISSPEGKLQIAPLTDKRPAVEISTQSTVDVAEFFN